MSDSWYEAVDAKIPLTQGDLVFDCPLLTWNAAGLQAGGGTLSEGTLKDLVSAFREDVVVMTQACDLEHRKVEHVVLCPHVPLSTFRLVWERWMAARKQNPSEKAWKRACRRYRQRLRLEPDLPQPLRPPR